MKKFCIILILCFCLPIKANAGFLDEAWGILTDPLKLGKSSSNLLRTVDRAAIHAERLEGKLNSDLRDRLSQLDGTIKETREFLNRATAERIDQLTNNITALQVDFFQKSATVIKCSVNVTLNEAQVAIANTLNDLGKRKPGLSLFGFTIFEVEIEASDINTPIEGFREIKKLVDRKLADVKPTDHPNKITDLYAKLYRQADKTYCHYKAETEKYYELYTYELEYIRRANVWKGLTSLQ